MHENLLDLTHLSYLHAGTFGTPDFAFAPYEIDLDDAVGRFTMLRTVSPTRRPPVWSQTTGITHSEATRIAQSDFLSPGAHMVTGHLYDATLAPSERQDFSIRTAHLVTPETVTCTHYFVHHGRNFYHGDDGVTEYMCAQLVAAFREDVDGLALVEQMVADTPVEDR